MYSVEQTPYPPAPWQCTGPMWFGLFRSSLPRILPNGLKPILDPHLFLVAIVRYLEGTLCYDELFFSTPAWFGMYPGLHVDEIWVDSRTSLWGGRRIWGLPKKLAQFTWQDSTLVVNDHLGLIGKIALNQHPGRLPWLWVTAPIFGYQDHHWLSFWPRIWGWFDVSAMQILAWSNRYPALASEKSIVGLRGKHFHITTPAPKIVTTAQA